MVGARVEYGAVRAFDPLLDLILVVHDIAELLVPGSTQRATILIVDELQPDGAGPGAWGPPEPTFQRATGGRPSTATSIYGRILTRWTYRVQVPLPRGSVMPVVPSINDDFPELWDPTTRMVGSDTSIPALYGSNQSAKK